MKTRIAFAVLCLVSAFSAGCLMGRWDTRTLAERAVAADLLELSLQVATMQGRISEFEVCR
jgi:hypothetical protein